MHQGRQPEIRYVESCTDYRNYRVALDTHITKDAYDALKSVLLSLGNAEPERMGVIYVRGHWGFLVIPQRGFHELRISFYHDTQKQDSESILARIATAVMESSSATRIEEKFNE